MIRWCNALVYMVGKHRLFSFMSHFQFAFRPWLFWRPQLHSSPIRARWQFDVPSMALLGWQRQSKHKARGSEWFQNKSSTCPPSNRNSKLPIERNPTLKPYKRRSSCRNLITCAIKHLLWVPTIKQFQAATSHRRVSTDLLQPQLVNDVTSPSTNT